MILTGLFFMAGEKGRLEAHIPGSLSLSLSNLYLFPLQTDTDKKTPFTCNICREKEKEHKGKRISREGRYTLNSSSSQNAFDRLKSALCLSGGDSRCSTTFSASALCVETHFFQQTVSIAPDKLAGREL